MGRQLSGLEAGASVGLHDAQVTGYIKRGAEVRVAVRKWDGGELEVAFTGVVAVCDTLSHEHELNTLVVEDTGSELEDARQALRELDYPEQESAALRSFAFYSVDGGRVLTVVARTCEAD